MMPPHWNPKYQQHFTAVALDTQYNINTPTREAEWHITNSFPITQSSLLAQKNIGECHYCSGQSPTTSTELSKYSISEEIQPKEQERVGLGN